MSELLPSQIILFLHHKGKRKGTNSLVTETEVESQRATELSSSKIQLNNRTTESEKLKFTNLTSEQAPENKAIKSVFDKL